LPERGILSRREFRDAKERDLRSLADQSRELVFQLFHEL
jgi:hypothetical protein